MTLWYILAGIAGGVIGGMGMGGGTLLIPALTVLCSVEQHLAQATNLIVFVPMSVVAIIIHARNGLIKGEYFWRTAVPATITGIASSLLVRGMDGKILGRCFGVFLIALGIYQFVTAIIKIIQKRSDT